MKHCSGCDQDLPESDFSWKSKTRGTRQHICKPCFKQYRDAHYIANKQTYVDNARKYADARRDRNVRMLIEYLADHPCVDCGETDQIVLQFDHVRGKKSFNISYRMQANSWEDLLKEIAKCDVRCANCHIRQTARRAGWLRAAEVL